jgi:hypothetical protein
MTLLEVIVLLGLLLSFGDFMLRAIEFTAKLVEKRKIKIRPS